MAKCFSIIAIIGITLTLAVAEPPRLEQGRRSNNLRIQNKFKFFSRQEQAPDMPLTAAPYPPAGVTPEIPFDLPTETEAPSPEPDQTYGPPEQTPDQSYLPPDQSYGPPKPDQTYGPPETDDIPAITEQSTFEEQPDITESEAELLPPSDTNLVSESLIQPRKNGGARSKSALLRSRSAGLHLRRVPISPRFNTVEIVHSDPVLIYTLH